ncbi:hypothetical protein CIG11343_0798 [Campylobacter iguaniorum]|nr:hypothetical protein [Campylobacter iguaniorum]ANE35835.1 hypothetical protein CIG11343_0798 [Campylobacter iguaniorum]
MSDRFVDGVHVITNLAQNDYHFLMALTGILCGFVLLLITFLIITNIKG